MTTDATVDLVRDFWWLIFPAFGMGMAIWGMASENAREAQTLREARERLERGQ